MTITYYPPLGSSANNPSNIQYAGMQVDAFGRLRTSNPFTLFDSQNRYAADTAFDSSTSTGGATTYVPNTSAVALSVTTASGSSASRQSLRLFPYQPGKSLFTMMTFSMNPPQTGLRQRVGYFNTNNGVYLEQDGSTVSMVIRTFTGGSVDNSRAITQANWNGDPLNGTGNSGITLDLNKTQILFFDFEWLGVGNVRCGFIINGQFIICHTFNSSNNMAFVYMQTAILPVRYEITNTTATAASATLQQICCTVMSEGGYEQSSQPYVARQTTVITVGTSFVPIVSMRLNSSYLGAVVIPSTISFLPTATGNYEVALIKNATLTGATWASTLSGGQVDIDLAATALTNTADNIVQSYYTAASNQSQTPITASAGYNWDLQLGVTQANVSDTYTLAARTLTGTNTGIGSLTFYNLTV